MQHEMKKGEEKRRGNTKNLLIGRLPVQKGGTGSSHKITKPTAWRGGVHVLEGGGGGGGERC